jgi:hypothetical protein
MTPYEPQRQLSGDVILLRRQELTHGSGVSQVAAFERGLAGARAPSRSHSPPIPAPQRYTSPARTRRQR